MLELSKTSRNRTRSGATLFFLLLIAACTQNNGGQETPLRDNPAFVKKPPGPECPPGMFLAGFLPHPTCMTDEIFEEYYGKEYGAQ